MPAPNHRAVVAQIKDLLVSQGVDLSGPCGAFEIVKRVAWALRAEQAGLLDKPHGNNCQGYAADIIAYPNGTHYDVLIDGGGKNGPTWDYAGVVDRERYRPAIDPGPAHPPPNVEAMIERLIDLQLRMDTLGTTLVELKGLIEITDGNNRRRYENLAALRYEGTVQIRFLGSAPVTLDPKLP